MEAGDPIVLAGCLQLVGIRSACSVGSCGRVGEQILAALDDSVGQKGTAVLLRAIIAVGDVGKVTGEAKLFVVGGVTAKTELVQPDGTSGEEVPTSAG
jgi:hypothetical protein